MKVIIGVIAILLVGGVYFYFEKNDNYMDDGSKMEESMGSEMEESEVINSDNEMMQEGAGDQMMIDGELTPTVEVSLDGFNFGYSQPTIEVNEGDVVKVTLTSTDGFHDWVVDEFSATTAKVQTGETSSVTFVADKAGTYEYYCSVGQHRQNGMVGTLVVK
ncbi:hypothetical protein CL653_03110 [bacterium]|nr:hypothetical protein [bacterium]|tara:strand:- start:400 stop:882 length:483 start_codon:yes stop_codon:yes gene_type:complete